MPEPSPAERLALLRQRWERDPKSRLFLQLAEEYRRAGRLSEAVRILESGLAHHPSYVAAQVVMGRCLLETGDMPRAVTVLERALALDPTQIVANRLLVEAYLGVENVAKARERLDLFRLLNDRDTEIGSLEARIGALGGVTRPVLTRGRSDDRSGERRLPVPASTPARTASPEALKPEPEPAPRAALEPAGEPETRGAFGSPASPAPRASSGAPSRRGRAVTPFGEIHRPADARRIVAAIAAGGIFPVSLRSPVPPRMPAEAPEPAPAPVAEAALLEAPAPFESSWGSAGEPEVEAGDFGSPVFELDSEVEAPPPAPPPAPAPPPPPNAMGRTETLGAEPFALGGEAPPPGRSAQVADVSPPTAASTTLGSLYLAQGHLEDAEESFEAVLRSRPGDAEARRGLEEVRRRKSEAAAAFFDELPAATPDSSAVVGGLTARKIELLRQFMARMRRGSSAHVS